ncbi:hypothetical protein [Rhodococcus sp. BE178]|uniref:hypothetical protein n=1 Tax=Rhodococcus sp. BE178 TaxID=2817737 RepID=UPI003D258722
MSTAEQVIAEHQFSYDEYELVAYWGCTGIDCDFSGAKDVRKLGFTEHIRDAAKAEHAAHVVAALTNAGKQIVDQDKLDGLRQWRDRVALALGVADEVSGYGVYSAEVDQAVERAESLVNIENEHDECPVWCDDCERIERPWSCTHCNGSGCGPGTALGAYSECEWCAGSGREHIDTFAAAARVAEGGDRP